VILRGTVYWFAYRPSPNQVKDFRDDTLTALWQGDTFQFRISGIGKVYVTGFSDDRSRYRIVSKTYLKKGEKGGS